MQKLSSLTVAQLQRAVMIKRQIESLQRELDLITGESTAVRRGNYARSAEVRARMALSQKARWANRRKQVVGNANTSTAPKKRKMSAAGRAAIGAAAKARWAKIKAEQEATA